MCGLTTEWILESAQSLACALIRRTFYALERRTTHSSEWEGTQTLRRERQAHRWPSGWGEQCWLDQQGERLSQSSGGRRTHSSEWEGTQTLRRERHAQRWPSNEGSNAGSTYNELWRAENSFLRMRRNSDAQQGIGDPGKLIPQNERELTLFCLCLAGNFHLTSVRWSLRWLQGN